MNDSYQRPDNTAKRDSPFESIGREGGDDALENAVPTDPLNDQKVIVNHPDQTARLSSANNDSKKEGDPSGKLAD